MRTPERKNGRFASLSGLSTIRCGSDAAHPCIVIDAQGLPLFPYTHWYALRIHDDGLAKSTVETYLGYLLPFAGYLHFHGVAWNNSPEVIRDRMKWFLRTELHLIQHPDEVLEGVKVHTGAKTPLKPSTLRGMFAAWRDFYTTMRDNGLYVYPNPIESALLKRLNRERHRHIRGAGAPDHAGIRAESHADTGRRPSAFFRVQDPGGWSLPQEFTDPNMLMNLARAFNAMLAAPRLSLRDKSVLLLLRYTGARIHEICAITAGGYRSHTTTGIPGRAMVINKGGGGLEDKLISFQGRPDITQHIERYVRRERSRFDPGHRTKVSELDDHEPLFLTQRGTPLTYDAFHNTWRRIYPYGKTHVSTGYSIHDLRHLLVTELLAKARQEYGATSQEYAEAKKSIINLFGWRTSDTIDVYDHMLSTIDTLALLTTLQRVAIASSRTSTDRLSAPVAAAPSSDLASQPTLAPLVTDQRLDAWISEASAR